jgi:ATP-dependent protease ClpP protease subunit
VTTRTRRRPPRASRGLPAPAAQAPGWYHISPVYSLAAEDPEQPAANSADVYVYDVIGGWWGMTADDFVRDVASLDVDQIVLHLNSPGGDASEGVAIANVLRAHRARVVVRVDGWAASAGSVIAMAGDEIVMGIGSQMMIHDAWGFSQGNAAEMRKAAEMLDSTSNALASTYAARTGGSTTEWRAVMEEEAWYTAEEAVAAGLADRIATSAETGTAEGEQITPGATSYGGFWDLWDSVGDPGRFDAAALPYAYAGRAAAPPPRIPARTTPAAAAAGSAPTDTQERSPAVAFSDEQLTIMRQRLNLADDADEAAILAALDTRPAEPVQPSTPAPGTVVLDEAQHQQLLADARDGRDARKQQLAERREQLVKAAISDGRIPPARKADWLAYLETSPNPANAEADLANLKPGLVPLEESGYASKDTPADPAGGDDYWFAGVPSAAGVKVEA